MPRVPATDAPDFQAVVRDVKRFGPLTQAYGEHLAQKMGMRMSNTDPMPYTTRRSRGSDFLRSLVFRGEATETDVARAVWKFHLDRSQAAEMAHRGLAPLTHDYK